MLTHVYALCPRCQESSRLTVDLRVHPWLGGKIGAVCDTCGAGLTYTFSKTAQEEREYQAKHQRLAAESEVRRREELDAWQQFHLDQTGLPPQPQYPDDCAYDLTSAERHELRRVWAGHAGEVAQQVNPLRGGE